jgi:hypothetical protein
MKNGTDSTNDGAPGALVELSGLEFLSTVLDCCVCEWRGEVGDMRVHVVSEPQATEFSCPRCLTKLARYQGQLPEAVWKI